MVTIKDGWVVQSFGYHKYLPIGKAECVVENLDRWGADEILLQVIDRSVNQLGPDISLLERIALLGLETPLIYAGGIRSIHDGVSVIQSGADRVVLDTVLHDNPEIVFGMAEKLGAQALIAALPLSTQQNELRWLDYRQKNCRGLSSEVLDLFFSESVSEALLIDWKHEGVPLSFDSRLIELFPEKRVPLILFGGINSEQTMRTLLENDRVSAVAVGNFLHYREHSIQSYKKALFDLPIRPPEYQSN